MRIRWKINVAGTVHGRPDGVQRGDILDVEDEIGARYCRFGYAEPVAESSEERAVVVPEAEVRTSPPPSPKAKAPTTLSSDTKAAE